MKLIIFGSRDIHLALDEIDYAIRITPFVVDLKEIVCGMAKGADTSGHRWAKARGIPIKEMPADWERYGAKLAGKIRNKEMAKYADAGIGFWKNESGGTANMATHLLQMQKPVRIF